MKIYIIAPVFHHVLCHFAAQDRQFLQHIHPHHAGLKDSAVFHHLLHILRSHRDDLIAASGDVVENSFMAQGGQSLPDRGFLNPNFLISPLSVMIS